MRKVTVTTPGACLTMWRRMDVRITKHASQTTGFVYVRNLTRLTVPRPRKYSTEQERRQAQNELRKLQRATKPVKSLRRFTGIDGEGIGEWKTHTYVLLGIGNAQTENPAGLTFENIMTSLWDAYSADPNSIYAGFFLGYDFSQWFRTLPMERAQRLFTPETRKRKPRKGDVDLETGEVLRENPLGPWPVNYQGWEFDLLGMKRFKLRKEGAKQWMYVNDAGPFFQASLLTVINPREWAVPVVSEDEYRIVREGKERRDSARLDDDMRFYNRLENEILGRLLGRLDQGFQGFGVRLGRDQWFGPGQAAQAWLGKVRAPTGEVVRKAIAANGPNGNILDKGRMTYYGGWFEIFAHGIIPRTSWEYDINSAYPFIAATLPCLLHGRWEPNGGGVGTRHSEGTALRIVHARIHGSNPICGTMLHRRTDHSIHRPWNTKGYFWEHELAAAIRAGVIDEIEVYEGVEYLRCGCSPPLGTLAGLYSHRVRVGKNTPEGKAAKLVYNSVYGKFAQSIGNPRYSNSLYASLITAGCRTMILDAIGTHPGGTRELLMVATDGVYFRSRHPGLKLGEKMGEWEEAEKSNLTLFKPGVYWDDSVRERIRNGHDPRFKSRGISAKAFAGSLADIDSVFSRWGQDRENTYPSVTFTSGFSMITCKQALQRGKWSDAGTLGHQPNELCPGCSGAHLLQDSNPVQKRNGLYADGDIWRSSPWENRGSELRSMPYDRTFGQPDPDEYGITDDGTVLDSWRLGE